MRTILYPLAVGLALVPTVVRGDEIHEAAKAGYVARVKTLLAADPALVQAANAKPSRNTSLPATRTCGKFFLTAVNTNPVPQPISRKLSMPAKYFCRAHSNRSFRDSNQKWPHSISAKQMK